MKRTYTDYMAGYVRASTAHMDACLLGDSLAASWWQSIAWAYLGLAEGEMVA